MVKNEARYMREWITLNNSAGISDFLIYDNGSVDDLEGAVNRCRSVASITIQRWLSCASWRETQTSAFMHAAKQLAGTRSFVAFIDVDEFLLCSPGQSLQAIFDALSEDVSAVAVCQRIFGSSGLEKDSSGFVTTRFIRRAEDQHDEHRWFKTIARPERIVGFRNSHSLRVSNGKYVYADGSEFKHARDLPGISEEVVSAPIVLNHYILKSLQEFKDKKDRWMGTSIQTRYSDEYFKYRDSFANAVTDERLSQICEQLIRDRKL
jgi:hypothetical protein